MPPEEQLTVLVVDDSAIDRRIAGGVLQRTQGVVATYAQNGREALQVIENHVPDVVVTDLQMPEMDGLQLVSSIRRDHPSLPVILMTAHGSEEIAVKALKRGAVSYVPKRNLAADLRRTVENVLGLARANRTAQRVFEGLVETRSHFELTNDVSAIPALIGHLEQNLRRMKLCDETGLIQVEVALREALVNAMLHGNLEVPSGLRETAPEEYTRTAEERARTAPWGDRRVRLTATESRTEAVYLVEDDGQGFDPTTLPDPTDPANLEKVSGRGLLLIRTFMDEVTHNDRGNAIRLVKRRDRGNKTSDAPPSGTRD